MLNGGNLATEARLKMCSVTMVLPNTAVKSQR